MLFSLTLVLLILSSMLASCVNNPPEVSSVESAEASEAESTFELKKKDMEGDEIIFLVPDNTYAYYESFEIYAEELNNEVINDAVFNRNATVEDYYKCSILAEKSSAISDKIRTNVDSGITYYDVYMPMMNDAVSVAADGYLYDLNSLENLNLKNAYWDQAANESLELAGKLYMTTGDISTLDNDCTMVMFFNKRLVSDNGMESPYDMVKDNKWTLDNVYEMSREFTSDNGDSKWNNEDKYGLHVAFNATHSFFFGCGGRTTTNEDGTIQLVMDSEANVTILNNVFDVAFADDVVTNKTAGCATFETICEMFTNKQIIFTTFALIDIKQFRYAKDFEFGILPYPLADENQEDYICFVSTGLVPAICFPKNADKLDNATLAVEAMAYYSTDTLTKAYYEQTLMYRDLQDNDSEEMLDIIFKSRAYDMGFIYGWGGIRSIIQTLNDRTSRDFVSAFGAIKSAVLADIESTLEEYASDK